MQKIYMKNLGLTENLLNEAKLYKNLYIGRVLSQAKGIYRVMGENGELMAEVSGKFRFEANQLSDFPAVGDFVLMDRDTSRNGSAMIHHVLSRKSVFIRKAAGTSNDEQVVASNIDTIFICMSLNHDFNIRRLERYLSIAWDSGATPVIVLTKSDLCDALEKFLLEVESVAIGTDIVITSAINADGYLEIMKYMKKGQTASFIGSSGVGKSTLINGLIGENQLNTGGLRNDDKGRHTTTRRELIILSNGSMVIDTPGMRELGLESANFSQAFADIGQFAMACKFRDCTHTSEPGCAVQQAILNGMLSEQRLASYQKLKKEAKYEGLDFKQIETKKLNEMFSSVGGMKNAKKYIRQNRRK